MGFSDELGTGDRETETTAASADTPTRDQVVRRRNDNNEGDLVVTIMEAVTATDRFDDADPSAMTPLYEVIDAEALEGTLSASAADEGGGEYAQVSFVYEGCHVTVDSAGVVEVTNE